MEEEEEIERTRRAKIMQYMNPRVKPVVPRYIIIFHNCFNNPITNLRIFKLSNIGCHSTHENATHADARSECTYTYSSCSTSTCARSDTHPSNCSYDRTNAGSARSLCCCRTSSCLYLRSTCPARPDFCSCSHCTTIVNSYPSSTTYNITRCQTESKEIRIESIASPEPTTLDTTHWDSASYASIPGPARACHTSTPITYPSPFLSRHNYF